MMSDPAEDRQAIRELAENWVLWRGAGDWERFMTVWHSDGSERPCTACPATWCAQGALRFIERRSGRWGIVLRRSSRTCPG
jgi:hypothetical protein